jgi:UDP-N-acetylmuramoyl-tripeptide--D-alanyl-D-alanine ligase
MKETRNLFVTSIMVSIEQLYEVYKTNPVVSTDTRTITPGCIFFALKGANFNGNKFAAEAVSRGAAYAVVDEQEFVSSDKCLLVTDVLKALQDLSAHHRKVLGANGLKVVALTGSNGKTTTKELIARVLAKKYKVLFTQGNLNNHIGVPLTLLRLTASHEIAVIEMGANHQGEIRDLCAIADPDCGLITNIGLAHLEGFGGEEGVFRGKTEMLMHLEKKEGGFAFLLEDEVRLHPFKSRLPNISYGTDVTAMVQGTLVSSAPFVTYQWHTNGVAPHDVHTQMIGAYNLPNMLGATAVGMHFGVNHSDIDDAIATYSPDNNRSQIEKRGSNTLILDCYNANPSSMIAAIENMAATPAKKKMLILGDMFELGASSAAEHQRIVNFLSEKTPDATVIVVGDHFAATSDRHSFMRMKDALEVKSWLGKNPPDETLILIKGSRGMKMEFAAEALQK